MKHRLIVKIEKRFKRQLSERFNPKNAESYDSFWDEPGRYIDIGCSLCDVYWLTDNDTNYCGDCPFYVYRNKHRGCLEWILRIVGKRWRNVINMDGECVEWDKEDNKRAIELLKKLREKAKKYIVWTENTK